MGVLDQLAAALPSPEIGEELGRGSTGVVLAAHHRRLGRDVATPASNQDIAAELVVSVDAVKTHLRAMFDKFELGDLPRSAKRVQLVKRALPDWLDLAARPRALAP